MAGAECRGPQIKFLLENWSFVQVTGEGQQSVASCKHVAYANSYSQSAGQGKLTSNKDLLSTLVEEEYADIHT